MKEKDKYYRPNRWIESCGKDEEIDKDREWDILEDILNTSRRRVDQLRGLAASKTSQYVYRRAAIARLFDIGNDEENLELFKSIFSDVDDPSIGTRLEAFIVYFSIKSLNLDFDKKSEVYEKLKTINEEEGFLIKKYFGDKSNYVRIVNSNQEFLDYRAKGYDF